MMKILSLEAKEDLIFYFPQLGKVIESIEARSPSLKILKQSENEAYAKTQIAESLRGTKINLSIGSHSIHEDRPGRITNKVSGQLGLFEKTFISLGWIES